MALQTLPAINISYSSAPELTKPRIQRYSFGDGYSQRVGLGINPIDEAWQVVYLRRTATDKNTLTAFFKAHNGTTAFYWTPTGESTPRKYTCPEWRAVPVKTNRWDIHAKFIEEFDL